MHKWREVGRVPVTLVRSVCDCGCKRQRLELVDANGSRSLPFDLPSLRVNQKTVRRVQNAVQIGQEMLGFWQRVRGLVT